MALLKPDPTFHASPARRPPRRPRPSATSSPSTRARTATAPPTRCASSTSTRPRRATAPSSGGWTCPRSATSCTTSAGTPARRALCPWAAHPHVERRYLLIPGLRSSRLHVVDVKGDPHQPKLEKVVEADEIARKAGYSRPHTDPLRPRRDLRQRARRARRRRPRRDLPARPRELLGQERLGAGPRAAGAGLRLLVAHRLRHGRHQRVGDAEHGRGRPDRRAAARQQVRPPARTSGTGRSASTSRPSTSAPSTRWCWSCARPTTRATPTASSAWSRRPPTCRASVFLWRRADDGTVSAKKVISIPAEPAEADQLPPLLQPFGAVPPLVTDIALSVDDSALFVSCWGTGEIKRFDVTDPDNPRETGSVRLGGIVERTAHPAAGR